MIKFEVYCADCGYTIPGTADRDFSDTANLFQVDCLGCGRGDDVKVTWLSRKIEEGDQIYLRKDRQKDGGTA